MRSLAHLACLLQEHRHAFVRKNAVFTVFAIYKLHEHLIPDAPELLLTFLAAVGPPTIALLPSDQQASTLMIIP